MKKTLIAALVCVNVALVVALILGPGTPRAEAQPFRGAVDYLMITGQISDGYDALYVIDLAKRRMLAWKLDRTRKVLVPYRGRELRNDFARRGPE